VFSDGVVAGHARLHSWNGGPRTAQCVDVAVQAFHLRLLEMRFVIEGDGLHRFGPVSKEMLGGKPNAGVGWSKNAGGTYRSIFDNGLPLQDAALKKKPRTQTNYPQGAQDDEQRDHSAMRMPAVSDYFHTASDHLKVPPKVCNLFLGMIPSLNDT